MARLDIFAAALRALESGRGVAIATVIGAHGSTPRHLGARMAVAADGAVGYDRRRPDRAGRGGGGARSRGRRTAARGPPAPRAGSRDVLRRLDGGRADPGGRLARRARRGRQRPDGAHARHAGRGRAADRQRAEVARNRAAVGDIDRRAILVDDHQACDRVVAGGDHQRPRRALARVAIGPRRRRFARA
ncbi:MAG: XdhC family protein, partial [Deltaproteobacteria bacterium]|nr:XdhC family protein [Deltaproteobacteria bacterium]